MTKRILITGGRGFLGSHLCEELKRRGYPEVSTFSSSSFDLTRKEDTKDVFNTFAPDVVFHLAAKVGGIGANRKSPATFWRDTLMMGLNTLEGARKFGVEKFVLVATTCGYPKFPPRIPFMEEDLFKGYPEETNAPYGIAKNAMIVGARAYRQQFGMNIISLIPTNLYGPGDNFHPESSHVIPAMILKMHEAKLAGKDCVTLWGTGSPTRDFLYVSDAAEALVNAMEKYDDADPVNIGSGKEVQMTDLAEAIKQAVGYEGQIEWDITKPDGQPRRCLNTDRAIEKFGWKAMTPLKTGLDMTCRWFAENRVNKVIA